MNSTNDKSPRHPPTVSTFKAATGSGVANAYAVVAAAVSPLALVACCVGIVVGAAALMILDVIVRFGINTEVIYSGTITMAFSAAIVCAAAIAWYATGKVASCIANGVLSAVAFSLTMAACRLPEFARTPFWIFIIFSAMIALLSRWFSPAAGRSRLPVWLYAMCVLLVVLAIFASIYVRCRTSMHARIPGLETQSIRGVIVLSNGRFAEGHGVTWNAVSQPGYVMRLIVADGMNTGIAGQLQIALKNPPPVACFVIGDLSDRQLRQVYDSGVPAALERAFIDKYVEATTGAPSSNSVRIDLTNYLK